MESNGIRFSDVFTRFAAAAERHPRYISMPGGTRSGKTYSILQWLMLAVSNWDRPGDVSSVVSETLPHLKRGAIRDFERIMGHPLKMDDRWNASENTYTFDNGAKLEFFSADTPGKVMGPGRKRLFINECNHVPYETARQLFVRTTDLIILDYNPAATFWCIERVEPRENCVVIHSTYEDNREFLTQETIDEIEANRDDENWWRVYGLGLLGTLEGVIYDFEQVDDFPVADDGFREVWGLDFGFHDPTAIVQMLADPNKKVAYIKQIAHRSNLKNGPIADILAAQHIKPAVRIWADAAEPKSIAEIGEQAHVQIKACDKSAPVKSDRRKFQIQWLQGWRLYITKDSVDVIREFRNYIWEPDENGRPTDTPIHKFSHGPDAVRYGLWSEFAEHAGAGQYVIGFNR